MTRRQRLRRVAILCCHCLRNLAYFKAWQQDGENVRTEQFWITTNNNFLDIAVLEWCKLFGDLKGKHHWGKVISDGDEFFDGLLAKVVLTKQMFDDYIKEMRTYRDEFIAHLDDEERMQIPNLVPATKSAVYLYEYLIAHEDEDGAFHDAHPSASAYYRQFLTKGKAIYAA